MLAQLNYSNIKERNAKLTGLKSLASKRPRTETWRPVRLPIVTDIDAAAIANIA